MTRFISCSLCCRMTSTNGHVIIVFTTSTQRRTPTLTTPCEGFSLLTSAGCWSVNILMSSRRDASWRSVTWRPIRSSCFRGGKSEMILATKCHWSLYVSVRIRGFTWWAKFDWTLFPVSGTTSRLCCWCASSSRCLCPGSFGGSRCGWRISSRPSSDTRLC